MRREKKKSFGIWLLILLGLCIIGLGIAILWLPGPQKEESGSSEWISEEPESSAPEEPERPIEPLLERREIPQDTEVAAEHAFVYDVRRGTVLFAKGGMEDSVYEASVTKLYTAYVALQILDPDEVVTAGTEVYMVGEGASVAYIAPGYQLTVDMLVEAMMLPSGNDAAYMLAAAAGRRLLDEEDADAEAALAAFMEQMNRQAEIEGFVNTHFVTPDGDHDDAHYTCMEDLIRIAQKAMTSDLILKYTVCAEAEVTYVSGAVAEWKNSNRLIHPDSEYYRPEVFGLKTGTTEQAGCCLLTAAQCGEDVVIIGVFGCPESDQRYEDTLRLLDAYEKGSVRPMV